MVRLVLAIAVFAVGFVVVKQRVGEAGAGRRRRCRRSAPRGCRAEFQTLLAPVRTRPRSCPARRAPRPRVDQRLAGSLGGSDDASATSAVRPFADVGSRARAARRPRATSGATSPRSTASPRCAAAPRPQQVSATLAEVYSAPVLAALGADGLRAFAERFAGRTEVAQKVKVLDFDGVFVSGRRALAQVVYRLSMRGPSGRYVARAPATWTVTLAHEDGRWRFVRGLETT